MTKVSKNIKIKSANKSPDDELNELRAKPKLTRIEHERLDMLMADQIAAITDALILESELDSIKDNLSSYKSLCLNLQKF